MADTNNMNLPDPGRKLSMKDRIKLFSKTDCQTSDIVRLGASTGSPSFSPKRGSVHKRPTSSNKDGSSMPVKFLSVPTKRSTAPFPPPVGDSTQTSCGDFKSGASWMTQNGSNKSPRSFLKKVDDCGGTNGPNEKNQSELEERQATNNAEKKSEREKQINGSANGNISRKGRIEEELLAYFHQAEEEELGKEMREEGKKALKIAAYKFAYKRKYLDMKSDQFVTFPSVKNCLAGSEIYEEAEKYYYDPEDEFPLKYIAALKHVATMDGGVPDGDEDMVAVSEEIEDNDDEPVGDGSGDDGVCNSAPSVEVTNEESSESPKVATPSPSKPPPTVLKPVQPSTGGRKRKKMIENELMKFIRQAEDEELEKEMRQEGVDALKKSAIMFAYRKKYLDLQSNKFVPFPSVMNCLAGTEIYEEAEKYYYDPEDEFPLKYIAALKHVATMAGGVPDGDEEKELMNEEIVDSDDELFVCGDDDGDVAVGNEVEVPCPQPPKDGQASDSVSPIASSPLRKSSLSSRNSEHSTSGSPGDISEMRKKFESEKITTNQLNEPPPPPLPSPQQTSNKLSLVKSPTKSPSKAKSTRSPTKAKPTKSPTKAKSTTTNHLDGFLSPVRSSAPHRRDSTNSTISAVGSNSGNKTPRMLRKKIEKCHELLKQESPNSSSHQRLTVKLEQYEDELHEVENMNNSIRSNNSRTNKHMKTLREEPGTSEVAVPIASTTSTIDFDKNLLELKIEKVQAMLIKEKDPTIFVKLTAKLEQYQRELSAAKNGKSTPLRRPSRRRSIGSLKKKKEGEDENDLKLMQRKLRKVDKLMGDLVKKQGQAGFKTSDFKKLLAKREEYLEKLEEAGIKQGKFTVRKGIKSNEMVQQEEKRKDAPERKPLVKRKTPRRRSNSFIAPPPLMVGNKARTAQVAPISEDAPAVVPADKSTMKRKKATGPKKKTEKVCAARLQELDGKYTPKVFAKTNEDADIIRNELAKNFIFQKVPKLSLEQMLQAFEPVSTYTKGDVIIQQGDAGDYFYILGKGSVRFEVNEVDVGGTDQPGASFGELALLYQSPRKATVRANSEDMLVYRVDQVTFRYILQSRSKWLTLWRQTVNKIMAMNRLLGSVAVAEKLKDTSEHDDSEKDHSDHNDADGSDDGNMSIGSLDVEEALEKHDDIDVSDHEDQELSMYMSQLSQRRLSIKSSLGDVGVNSFRRSSMLGEGQFGEVWLVQAEAEEIGDEQFALKIQSKEDMNRASADYSVAEAIERECKVLSELCHPFIVDFVYNFEDDENIYLVMTAIKGQELWNRIHREEDDGEWVSGISESESKFYAILIADTLHYMHRQQICYRDMKPENVMIDHTGYPIVVDFGFAKVVPDDKTYTFCGTPQYTAPEIIANQGHGRPVDNWALGIVINEMISGENPFWYDGISDLQLLNDISNSDPEPIKDDEAECSDEAKDIVAKLLEKDPAKRPFGKAITSHPWFDSIDINKARKMEVPAPWAPQLNDDDSAL